MGAHFDRGVLLYKLKNYKQAEKEFREDLVGAPQSASAHAMLGMTLNVLRKTKQAHAEAMESARLSPAYAYAHYTLSYTFAQQNRLKEAETAINEALRLNPQESYLFARATQLQALMRNHEKAFEFADRGVACDPEDDGCLVQRATAQVELGRLHDADESLNAALSLNAENQLGHLRKGDVQLQLGNKTAAFDHYREALRLKPDDAAARAGALSAVKSKNWLYYSLLMLTVRMRRVQSSVVVVLGILLLVPHFRILVCLFLFLAVVLGQCHVFLLRFDRQFRPLLTKAEISKNNFYVGLIVLVVLGFVLVCVLDWSHAPFQPKPSAQEGQLKDYPPYMRYVQKKIKENWSPETYLNAKTVVHFYIDRDGNVSSMRVKSSSGNQACDRAALDALAAAAPFPPLPKPEAHPVPVDFTFDYQFPRPDEKNAAKNIKAIPSAKSERAKDR